MQSSVLVSSFAEIAREKGIDRDALQIIMEDVFRAMIRKRYGADESFEIIFNPDHGDIQILHIREVVPDLDVEDPVTQIEASEAVEIDEDFEIGDEGCQRNRPHRLRTSGRDDGAADVLAAHPRTSRKRTSTTSTRNWSAKSLSARCTRRAAARCS